MPIVGVNRDKLFEALGETFSKCICRLKSLAYVACPDADNVPLTVPFSAAEEQFDALCFEYGIELDDVVSVPPIP
jgi:hypothetical protein